MAIYPSLLPLKVALKTEVRDTHEQSAVSHVRSGPGRSSQTTAPNPLRQTTSPGTDSLGFSAHSGLPFRPNGPGQPSPEEKWRQQAHSGS